MELSRQRLRPALNEGSHITCPRCNGTGVIRDTESSALHVLRLLQEEAMKESTAAVHAQVPVDVATFLLNEKRADIAKIEARLKVNLVLIPNKNLETPHHHVERLRHDDPRLEETKTSFDLVIQPEQQLTWAPNKAQEAKTRPEALVKTLPHSQPAPVAPPAAPRAAAKPAQGDGLIKRLINWLTGAGASAATQPAADEAAKTQQGARNKASRHSGERRERGHGGDRNRHRRGERRPDAIEGKTDEASSAPAARPRRQPVAHDTAAASTEPRVSNAAAAAIAPSSADSGDTGGSGRNGRNRRGRGRNRRDESQSESVELDNNDLPLTAAAEVSPSSPVAADKPSDRQAAAGDSDNELSSDNDQLDPERKRRRRRSRRGRRTTEAGAEASGSSDNENDSADNDQAFVPHATPAFNPQVLPAIATAQGGFAPVEQESVPAQAPAMPAAVPAAVVVEATPIVPDSPEDTAAQAPVPGVTVAAAAAVETQTVETVPAQATTAESAPAQAVPAQAAPVQAAPVETAPVQVAIAETIVPAAAPVQEAAPAAVPAAPAIRQAEAAEQANPEVAVADAPAPVAQPKASSATLQETLNAVGMELIETKSAPVQAPAEPVRLGRTRKPAAQIANDPLHQVETH